MEQTIASYKRSNQQLSDQVGEQRKQILQLQEKMKESMTALQKVTNQKALKEQLEVHIQTIGILVSEKSELQSSLSSIQKKLSLRESELSNLNEQLKTTQGRLTDFQKAGGELKETEEKLQNCLLYTSDAADDTPCVDLGGRRIIKKKRMMAV